VAGTAARIAEEGIMRRLTVIVLAALVVVTTHGAAYAAAPSECDPGVRPVTAGGEAPDGRACYILWALSHGPYAHYTPSEWYSDLVDMLEVNSIISYEAIYDLNYIGLSSYDVIVIGTLLAWDEAHTAAEVTAIQDFVDGGGGLVIMGENSACPNDHINIISEAYGVSCVLSGSDIDGHITDFADIDLFAGVTSLELISAPGFASVDSPSMEIAWASGGESVMALAGGCSVIAVSDGNLWENAYLAEGDNETCALNVFDCLCSTSTGTPDRSTWGLIKALYR
jgi:hypothetical protein